jgi:hypothetical protein
MALSPPLLGRSQSFVTLPDATESLIRISESYVVRRLTLTSWARLMNTPLCDDQLLDFPEPHGNSRTEMKRDHDIHARASLMGQNNGPKQDLVCY